MPKKESANQNGVKQYIHDEQKRVNNPPVGLVTAETDHLNGKKTYQFDPHLDPQLQWAGKSEGVSLDVDTVSLHVHERIDPLTIIEAVRKKELQEQQTLFHYFETKENNPPIREAIEFYKHSQGWSNRLIAGDSLLVMNSLLEKEGMAGKVQMIYIDPPYGIKYGSNFQPFVNKRDVKDGKDEDLTQEPEMIKAFRDTWELGIHSYLSYLRDRLLVAKELLTENGSCFVQISDENVHLVRNIMDEAFGSKNFVALIPFGKTAGAGAKVIGAEFDYLVWYARDVQRLKCRQLYLPKASDTFRSYKYAVSPDASEARYATPEERADPSKLPRGWKIAQLSFAVSQDPGRSEERIYRFKGDEYDCGGSRHWKTKNPEGLDRLARAKRLIGLASQLNYIRYYDDFPATPLTNNWSDTGSAGFSSSDPKVYVVQTDSLAIQRCLLMTTDPGDLVLDPTCGSGTTAYVAEHWGRRWITIDTSRVSITLAKQRLMTALFDYYELAHPKEGISSGFNYEKVPHITLKSIANNEPPQPETLYDHPNIDRTRKRVTGPFTLEAVPSQRVRSFEDVETKQEADITIARSGETLKQNEWIDKMLSAGIRGKAGQIMQFVRIEPLPATRWVHAEAETKDGQKAIISFGPEYAPLEQRQVELAIEESQTLVPKPKK